MPSFRNKDFSHLKIILTFQIFKYGIYSIILSLTPVITSARRELQTEAPTQGSAETENREILPGLQVALQFVCD